MIELVCIWDHFSRRLAVGERTCPIVKIEGTPHLPIIAVSAACPIVVSTEEITHVSICARALRVGDHRQRGEEFLGLPDASIAINNSPLLVFGLQLEAFRVQPG